MRDDCKAHEQGIARTKLYLKHDSSKKLWLTDTLCGSGHSVTHLTQTGIPVGHDTGLPEGGASWFTTISKLFSPIDESYRFHDEIKISSIAQLTRENSEYLETWIYIFNRTI